VNEIVFHHAPINPDEFVHIIQDQITYSGINAMLALVAIISKVM